MVRYFKMGKESSYAQLPTSLNVGVRILSESLKLKPGLEYIRTVEGGRVIQTKQISKVSVEGDIDFYPVYDKGLGEFLLACLGSVNTTQVATGVYRHEFTPKMSIKTSPWPSYSFEIGLDDVVSKQILGAVVESLAFDVEAGDFLGVTASIYAAREQKAALGSPAPYSTLDYIHAGDVVTQTIGGNAVKFESFSLEIKNNFPEGYKFGSRYPQEIDIGPLEITGEMSIRFLNDAHFDDFLASNERAIVLRFQGPLITTGYNYYLEFNLPRVVYDAGDANINEQERLVQTLEFTALEHSTQGIIKVTLQNNQASY
ncbi:MAG: phage tail tube protein [Nitrososphaerales archaeon]|nr:phage tail tube protein [Nitrososphaerales archaeon]